MSLLNSVVPAGLVAAAGTVLLTGLPALRNRQSAVARQTHIPQQVGLRVCGAMALATVAVVSTGWIAAGAWAAALGFSLPGLVSTGRARKEEIARVEAVATWAEMLRDQAAAGVDLVQAVQLTSAHAAAAIAEPVARLAIRLRRTSPDAAFAAFADEVEDPTADLVAAALTIAFHGHARRVGEVLAALAAAAREQVSMRLRVERDRSRVRSVARSTGLVVLAWTAIVLTTSGSFFHAYDSPAGQTVMFLVGGLFALGIVGLTRLDRLPASVRR
jgi:tight adherence protein B